MSSRTFGEVLKEERERRGMSGEALAAKANLSQGLISKYENGIRPGTRSGALKIARAMATSDEGFSEDAYYSVVNALLRTLRNEPPELRPGQTLTYVTDPDAAIVAEAYEGLPSVMKSYVKGQVLSAADLARQMDREETIGGTRADHDDNPSRQPKDNL